MFEETIKIVCLIRKMMEQAQDHQNYYAELHRRNLEFQVEDLVFLKISLNKKVMRFDKSSKLSPRYMRPFDILRRVSGVTYQLALLMTLTSTHDVFHISVLKKYIPNVAHKIDFSKLEIQEDMCSIEKPLKILETKERLLRTKTIPMVKVFQRNHTLEEDTQEVEYDKRSKYPKLFPQKNLRAKFS